MTKRGGSNHCRRRVWIARKACKPDSVPRGTPRFDDHSSCPCVAAKALAANPDLLGQKRPRLATRDPYLALLPVGLAVPPLLPAARWALTPPFHPCRPLVSVSRPGDWRFHFCGAFRRVAPPGRYPAPLLSGVRTFLDTVASTAAIRLSAQARDALNSTARQWHVLRIWVTDRAPEISYSVK